MVNSLLMRLRSLSLASSTAQGVSTARKTKSDIRIEQSKNAQTRPRSSSGEAWGGVRLTCKVSNEQLQPVVVTRGLCRVPKRKDGFDYVRRTGQNAAFWSHRQAVCAGRWQRCRRRRCAHQQYRCCRQADQRGDGALAAAAVLGCGGYAEIVPRLCLAFR